MGMIQPMKGLLDSAAARLMPGCLIRALNRAARWWLRDELAAAKDALDAAEHHVDELKKLAAKHSAELGRLAADRDRIRAAVWALLKTTGPAPHRPPFVVYGGGAQACLFCDGHSHSASCLWAALVKAVEESCDKSLAKGGGDR